MPDIDTLSVKITANAQTATTALNQLSTSLKKVKTALSSLKDGVSVSDQLSKNLAEVNGALSGVSTTNIKKIQKLATALNDYSDAIKRMKSVGGNVKNIVKAMTTDTMGDVNVGKNVPMLDSASQAASSALEEVRDQTELSEEQIQAVINRLSFDFFGRITDRLKELGGAFKYISDFGKKVSNVFKKAATSVKEFASSLHTAGKKAKESTGLFGKFIKSIGRIALYRAIRAAIKGIGEAFEDGLKNAYYYSKQTGDLTKLAETLDRVKSATSQLINQLGAFWGEFKQFIAPAVEWIAEQIRKITEYLTELFAALNGDDYYQRVLYVAVAWDEAADAVDKYKHQLLGLDELNNLSKKEDKSNKKTDYSKDFEDVLVSPEMKSIGNTWQEVRKTISDALDGIYGDLLLPTATAAIGAILMFTGHPLIGAGMIIEGLQLASDKLKMNDELRGKIEGFFKKYESLFDVASAATIAVGALLLFVPGKRLLGLGLLLSGIAFRTFVKDPVKFSWGGLVKTLEQKFTEYKTLFNKIGAAAVAIGALLLFVPGMRGIGLGLILAGTAVKTLTEAKNFSWNGLLDTIQEKFKEYKAMFEKIAPAAVAIGSILLFIPGMQGIGLGLILAGTTVKTLAESENIQWDELIGKITDKFETIMGLFEVGSLVAGALGAVLLFVPGMQGVGLYLLKMAAPGLFAAAITWNWDGILKSLKEAWRDIRYWWNTDVQNGVNAAINWLEKQSGFLQLDINGDGQVAGLRTDYGTSKNTMGRAKAVTGTSDVYLRGNAPEEPSLFEKVWNYKPVQNQGGSKIGLSISDTFLDVMGEMLDDWVHSSSYRGVVVGKASGGVATRGSLFYAGEAGAEFVGNIGSTAAVANTEQMTDAIYKAAYMGMSKALQENGGNGFSGFEPATTDDLFIAMRKKASNYTKRTGNYAF